jgi:hypothetical protein
VSDYPEHDKLTGIAPESQVIGEFLEWIQHEKEIFLARVYTTQAAPEGEVRSEMAPWRGHTDHLLAAFFKIDPKKIEAEKREMLKRVRAAYDE